MSASDCKNVSEIRAMSSAGTVNRLGFCASSLHAVGLMFTLNGTHRPGAPRWMAVSFVSLVLLASLLNACGGGVGVTGAGSAAVVDSTPPAVASVLPANGSVAAPLDSTISATFSEPMMTSSLSASSFTLVDGAGTPVTGAISVSGNTATLAPSAPLAAGTTYTATITTAARDAAGNALPSNFAWPFTTVPLPDMIAPTVTATAPLGNATGVPVSTAITATFSAAMSAATITANSFTLVDARGAAVNGTVSYAGGTATFSPAANLGANTAYTATLTTAVQDAAGNALASNVSWTFTTAADASPPTVVAIQPGNGDAGVAIGALVTATFSKPMNNATLMNGSFSLSIAGGAAVSGTVSVAGNTATFNPTANLLPDTTYLAVVTTAATDSAGNPLDARHEWSFTTAPAVMGSPALGAHAVAYRELGASSATVVTPSLATQASGSVVLVSTGRGVDAAQAPVTDNKGNSYAPVGVAEPYHYYPTSSTAVYAAAPASGGAGHVITAPNSAAAPTDETTLAAVEIQNATRIQDFQWIDALNAPYTSLAVTTTGPATLVAVWWGEGDGTVTHTAMPDGGFTVIDSVLATGSLVQAAVATKNVAAAGTYSVTWTSGEAAQLWLIAVQ